MKYYMPELFFKVFPIFSLNKKIDISILKLVLKNIKLSKNLKFKKNFPIKDISYLLLIRAVKDMEDRNMKEVEFISRAIKIENNLFQEKLIPFFGDFEKPFLLAIDFNQYEDEDFFILNDLRKIENFIIIDSNQLFFLLIKDI